MEPSRADRVTRCAVHRDGAAIRLVGDVDVGNGAELGARVVEGVGAGIHALDLTGIRYFGSAGVRVVLGALDARPPGVVLRVTCAPAVFRVMLITGLLDLEGLAATEAATHRRSSVEAAE